MTSNQFQHHDAANPILNPDDDQGHPVHRYQTNSSAGGHTGNNPRRSAEENQLDGTEDFYERLFGAVVGFALFGGSITFQSIVTKLDDKDSDKQDRPISYKRARTFLAISWFLFTLDLCLSSVLTAALYVSRRRARAAHLHSRLQMVNLGAALVVPEVSVAAILFASLAVTAYCESVGWTAVGFVILLGVSILFWWFSYVGSNKTAIRRCREENPMTAHIEQGIKNSNGMMNGQVGPRSRQSSSLN